MVSSVLNFYAVANDKRPSKDTFLQLPQNIIQIKSATLSSASSFLIRLPILSSLVTVTVFEEVDLLQWHRHPKCNPFAALTEEEQKRRRRLIPTDTVDLGEEVGVQRTVAWL